MFKTLLSMMIISAATAVATADWPGQTPPDEVPVYLPPDYDPDEPTPLLVFLHGWAPISPIWYDILVPIQDDANDHGYIYAKPVGSADILGDYYWNATDACCDIFHDEPDHVGYILAVVEAIQKDYNVDPQRIHLIGQSNGGFMCHRMACEAPDMFASVVSLTGATWHEESNCQPTEPVHVLHIHGTLDPFVFWLGGYLGPELNPYPGAVETADYWATHNGCSPKPTDIGSINFDLVVPFSETTRWAYEDCDDQAAGSSELWEVTLGSHFPIITSEGVEALFNYLDTHPKPEPGCPADVTSDQQVTVADLLVVINDWGSEDSAADINGDGVVDIQDLLAVMNAWGPCP